MKIMHIISHFDLGGAERVAADIASSSSGDLEYHIVEAMRGRSDFTQGFLNELTGKGIKCHRSPIPDIRFHFIPERIAAIIFPFWFLPLFLRIRPQVVHAHTELPDMCVSLFFSLLPRFLKTCRLVRTIHNNRLWTGQKRIGQMVEKFYSHHALNIAISPGVAKNYSEIYGGERPIIIYNGVNETQQKPWQFLKKDRKNIIFSGRFEPQKGIQTLIYIIKKSEEENLPLHFHIFGDGSMKSILHDSLSQSPNITINKPVNGLASFLASFDYMIMPSQFEGLSLMAIEASMAGLPNIISGCDGLRETVPDSWPLIPKPSDSQDISHGVLPSPSDYMPIMRQIANDSLPNDLRIKAKTHALEHFSVSKMREEYERIYVSLTNGKPSQMS